LKEAVLIYQDDKFHTEALKAEVR